MEKIKVIQFIHGMSMGGAETLVKDYCLKLDKNKFDLTLVCLDNLHCPYDLILAKEKIKIIYISDLIGDLSKYPNLVRKILRRILLANKIRMVFREINPDIIHTHLTLNKYILYSFVGKRTKIFHTVHTEPSNLWCSSLHGFIDRLCLHIIIRRFKTTFITLHNNMKNKVNKLFNVNNSIVLNNGINFKRFLDLPNKKVIKQEENIPLNSFVIGHVGRFSEEKNHKFLLDVFEEIHKRNDKAFLLLIGDGELKNEINDIIFQKNLCKFVKILSNRSDVPRLMKAMDFFLFPSLYEGLGIVLIEAQQSGLKCLISDTIPDYAVISNLVKKISLEKSAKEWALQLEKFKINNVEYYNLDKWNMDNVIKELENMYIEAYNDGK